MKTLKLVKKCFTASACLVLALVMSFGAWNAAMAQSFPKTVPLPDGPYGVCRIPGRWCHLRGRLEDWSRQHISTGNAWILVRSRSRF